MARRFQRSKTSPEMGWIVGESRITYNFPGGDPDNATSVLTLFDFADLDPDALTGRIDKDKSDWFIKRVILDWTGFPGMSDTSVYDCFRNYQVAMCTIGNENAIDISTQNYGVFSPEVYNLASRLFRTWQCRAYIPLVTNLGIGDVIGTVVVPHDEVTVTGGWTMAPNFGSAAYHQDFEVSNAGLRNNQICALIVNQSRGPAAAYDWKEGDTLIFNYQYRVLLQKRR